MCGVCVRVTCNQRSLRTKHICALPAFVAYTASPAIMSTHVIISDQSKDMSVDSGGQHLELEKCGCPYEQRLCVARLYLENAASSHRAALVVSIVQKVSGEQDLRLRTVRRQIEYRLQGLTHALPAALIHQLLQTVFSIKPYMTWLSSCPLLL